MPSNGNWADDDDDFDLEQWMYTTPYTPPTAESMPPLQLNSMDDDETFYFADDELSPAADFNTINEVQHLENVETDSNGDVTMEYLRDNNTIPINIAESFSPVQDGSYSFDPIDYELTEDPSYPEPTSLDEPGPAESSEEVFINKFEPKPRFEDWRYRPARETNKRVGFHNATTWRLLKVVQKPRFSHAHAPIIPSRMSQCMTVNDEGDLEVEAQSNSAQPISGLEKYQVATSLMQELLISIYPKKDVTNHFPPYYGEEVKRIMGMHWDTAHGIWDDVVFKDSEGW